MNRVSTITDSEITITDEYPDFVPPSGNEEYLVNDQTKSEFEF